MSQIAAKKKTPAVAVREADFLDADSIAAIHAEGWRLNYAGFLPASAIEARDEHWRRQAWRRKLARERRGQYTFVVDAADRVAGFASGGPVRPHEGPIEGALDAPQASGITVPPQQSGITVKPAEIYSVYMSPDWQRRGWGRRLVKAVATRLAADGAGRLLLWCFEDNPNRAFFARIGGEIIASGQVLMADASPRETAYGWADIQGLIAACGTGANGE